MSLPQAHDPLTAPMTLPQAISLALLAGLLILFIWDRLRFDMIALLALLAAVACGIVPARNAFSGFSNPLLPLIASALVVSNAAGKSGLIEQLVRFMRPVLQRRSLQVGALTGAVAFLSAVVKNIGALAIFLPIAVQVARRNKRAVGEFLMPMSFGSLAGGMMTLIGTSPNIIASSLRQELLGEPYRMFDFLPVGLGITLIAIAFLSFGWRLLPVRHKGQDPDAPFQVEDYLSELRVPGTSALVGKTVGEIEETSEGSIGVTAIIREGHRRYTPARHWRIFADDILMVESNPQDLQTLVQTAGLELVGPEEATTDRTGTADTVVVEAVIMAESPMIGTTGAELRLRSRYGVSLVAISRAGRRTTTRLAQTRFTSGDVVALQGAADGISETLASLGCLPLAERKLQLGRPRRLVVTTLILIGCVAASATEIMPPELAFTAGAVLTVLCGILTLREAYDAIDWPILVLLGSLIPVGEAIRSTGTTDLIASWIGHASASLPIPGTLAMLLVITMLLTPLVHHAAAVIVMGPVALAIARQLGINGDPLLIAVAVGASCDFLSPIGHQCNTLVMGPGGYRFGDYWHLGLPLSILVVLLGTPLILAVWPLH
jgi:di/tricarboxylate transporter